MRSKLLIPGLAILVLAVAACGSSTKPSHITGGSPTSAGAPSLAFHVKLTGAAEVPPGAPKGSGGAVIALHDSTLQVCWRFAHLKGFTKPTLAHIHLGDKGTSGIVVVPLSTGTRFLHKGCVTTSATVIKAIAQKPHRYYVNIHSTEYPGGAVRAQL
jgi:CHRD domain